MLVVMQNHATQDADRRASSRSSRRWATPRGRCRASSARPSASSATTAASTARASRRCAGVAEVIHVTQAVQAGLARMAARRTRSSRSRPGVSFGGTEIAIIAGPCSVESEEQIVAAARAGARRRRDRAARRRVQAAQLAVLVPGTRQEGTRAARARAPRDRLADRHRSARRRRRASRRRSTPTAFRSARATCRTTPCSAPSDSIGKPVLLKRGMAATITDLLHERRVHPRRGQRRR